MADNTRRGGRRKGDSGRRNDGLLKRCGCQRKRWSDCTHPWWFNFSVERTSFRFNLNRRAGLPKGKPLSRTEAERWRDHFRTLARDGKITQRGRPLETAQAVTGSGRTVREVCDDFVDYWKTDPGKRSHRLPMLKKLLRTICRTPVNGTPFGDRVLTELRTSDIEAFRDARRRVLREREAERVERAKRIAAGDKAARKLPVSSERPYAQRGEVGINRTLGRLRSFLNWAIERGHYQGENPFLRNGRPAIRMAKEHARTRRLQADEEVRLLATASPHLHDLIIAACQYR